MPTPSVSTVELRFSALPAHVRTARLVAAAVARRAGVDEAVLDEVRLAVGEACSRAVELHRRSSPNEPVTVVLVEQGDGFEVSVTDRAAPDPGPDAGPDEGPEAGPEPAPGATAGQEPGGPVFGTRAGGTTGVLPQARRSVAEGLAEPLDEGLPPDVGLAVIHGLVDEVEVQSGPEGTVVRMRWPVDRTPPPA